MTRQEVEAKVTLQVKEDCKVIVEGKIEGEKG
jgi:hypothetical protein